LKFNPRFLIDSVQAWMPEQIAAIKLRGFVHDIGGEVLDSEPGLIRVRLLDPRCKPEPEKRSLFSFLGFRNNRKTLPQDYLFLDLYMEKQQQAGKSILTIDVVMRADKTDTQEDEAMRRGFGERIARELKAYLMSR